MKKKKVILFHVHNLLFGGIEKVLIELLSSLDPDTYDIRLSITHNLGEKEVLLKDIPGYVIVDHLIEAPLLNWAKKRKMTGRINAIQKVASELFIAPFGKAAAKARLKKIMKDANVIVDFDMTLAPFRNIIWKKRTIAFCHFSLPHYWNGNERKLARLAGRLAQYDSVVMLCDEMKDDAAKMFPNLAPKLIRQYNGIDFKRIERLGAEPLKDYPALEQSGFILSVGRLQASQKDFSTVVRAYADCRRKGDVNVPLVIVGQGSDLPNLKALAISEGIEDAVIFTGNQDNPFKWMTKARAFLFASKYEGLPTVLIEALALHCPIAATACPTGVREILMEGQCGSLVPVGDWQAMSQALKLLLGNESLREQYLLKSREILREFDMQHVVARFEKIIFPS